MKRILFILIITSLVSETSLAQNPIIGDIGVSDPHVRVFNDTVYLYSGHDSDPYAKTFIMPDWMVFSTTDLVKWRLRTLISPKDNYMGNGNVDCHAGDASERNGKYYFYFSDESRGIGVMTSDSPVGPFKDALGKPLIAPLNDPTVFIDDDTAKTPYIIWGKKSAGGGYHIARLNNDMISLGEEPRIIKINGPEWENAFDWQDKNYLFKHNDTYYLSWGSQYATSKNIYGPYECAGEVGRGYGLGFLAHGSFFQWKGQFYHIWCYYQTSPYIKYRETIISYCHFDNEGKLVTDTDFLDLHFSNGIGQYDASWPWIEAEWYYEISGEIRKSGSRKDGFVLVDIHDSDWIRFSNVTFGKECKEFTSMVSFDGEEGNLEIRADDPAGELLGKVSLSQSGGPGSFQEASGNMVGFKGTKDIYLVFQGSEGSTLQIDWFKFE